MKLDIPSGEEGGIYIEDSSMDTRDYTVSVEYNELFGREVLKKDSQIVMVCLLNQLATGRVYIRERLFHYIGVTVVIIFLVGCTTYHQLKPTHPTAYYPGVNSVTPEVRWDSVKDDGATYDRKIYKTIGTPEFLNVGVCLV